MHMRLPIFILLVFTFVTGSLPLPCAYMHSSIAKLVSPTPITPTMILGGISIVTLSNAIVAPYRCDTPSSRATGAPLIAAA